LSRCNQGHSQDF